MLCLAIFIPHFLLLPYQKEINMFNKILVFLLLSIELSAARIVRSSDNNDTQPSIKNISAARKTTPTACYVNFSGKRLHSIDDLTQDRIKDVTHLSFKNNRLTDFYCLAQLHSNTLIALDVRCNDISTLYVEDFECLCKNFPYLQKIDLRNNPLCKYEIDKVEEFCKKNNINLLVNLVEKSSSDEEDSEAIS